MNKGPATELAIGLCAGLAVMFIGALAQRNWLAAAYLLTAVVVVMYTYLVSGRRHD